MIKFLTFFYEFIYQIIYEIIYEIFLAQAPCQSEIATRVTYKNCPKHFCCPFSIQSLSEIWILSIPFIVKFEIQTPLSVVLSEVSRKWKMWEIVRWALTLKLKLIGINIDVIQLQANGIGSNFLSILKNFNFTKFTWSRAIETILSVAMTVFGWSHIDTKIWKIFLGGE